MKVCALCHSAQDRAARVNYTKKIEIYWDLIDGIQWDFNGNHGILWIFSWDFMDFNGTKHWMFFISQIRMERFGDLSLGNDLPSELNLHI